MKNIMNTYRITDNYIRKSNRKGSRDAELEDETGFKSGSKIHKNKKKYDRKIQKYNYND